MSGRIGSSSYNVDAIISAFFSTDTTRMRSFLSACNVKRNVFNDCLEFARPLTEYCIVNDCCVRSAFVAIQQGVFQELAFLRCDYTGLVKSFAIFDVDIFARWLLAPKTSGANSAVIIVVELCGVRVFSYNIGALV